MMDLNDENKSCHNIVDNTGDNVDEKLEQKPALNNAPLKISDNIDSESILENKETFSRSRQPNDNFQKDTDSCEIVANVWHSLDAFQRAIVNIPEKDNVLKASNGQISEKGRSSDSCKSGNLITDTKEPRIQVITGNNNKRGEDTGIIFVQALPVKESPTNGPISTDCENIPSISNARFHKHETHCNIFKEDADWDIYQPGIVTTEPIDTTGSSQESQLIREFLTSRPIITPNRENWSISSARFFKHCDFFNEDDDWDIYQPGVTREISYLPSNNLVSYGGTSSKRNEERMLKKVKKYFLKNPVQVTDNLSHMERMTRIIIAPYFNRNFALRHGLLIPTTTLIEELNLMEDPSQEFRVLAAFELIHKSGVSGEEFVLYISMDNLRREQFSTRNLYTCSGLDPSTIQHLDIIQELVGHDIFPVIFENLRAGDEDILSLFNDPTLLNDTIQFLKGNEPNEELMRQQYTNIGDNFLTQNQDDSYDMFYDFKSEDTLVSQTNADFPSRLHVIKKTPCINGTDSNAYADDSKAKAYHKVLRTSPSSSTLSEVQSTKPDDILETELNKSSPIMQSTNQSKEIGSFDSCRGYSDTSNHPPDSAFILLPRIQNSNDQSDKVNSRKVHLVKSRNSPKSATLSSDQNFKENSRRTQLKKAYEVLENVSNVQTGVRKHISQDDEEKTRKKIRLQENSNTDQSESKKEESPIKDESRDPSEESWPGKPTEQSCIVM